MTWKELREQITELGFNVVNYEYEDIYSENKNVYIFSVNRAIELIASTVRPILGEYVIKIKDDNVDGLVFVPYNIRLLAGKRFYDFAFDLPMLETPDGDYRPLTDYQTQKRGVILIPGFAVEAGNKIRVWYKKKPVEITVDTPDDFTIELDHDVLPLVPLLASHYVWLDDEPNKAGIYWNEYDILKNQLLQNSAPTITEPHLINTTGWW